MEHTKTIVWEPGTGNGGTSQFVSWRQEPLASKFYTTNNEAANPKSVDNDVQTDTFCIYHNPWTHTRLCSSSRENVILVRANNKCADQPAYMCSLISALVVRSLECITV